jgi:hypothetical protein
MVHPEVTSAALTGAGGGEGRHTDSGPVLCDYEPAGAVDESNGPPEASRYAESF